MLFRFLIMYPVFNLYKQGSKHETNKNFAFISGTIYFKHGI